MTFIPMNFALTPATMAKEFYKTALKIKNGTEALPFSYYDLPIDDKFFCEIEITPSPQMTAGFCILLNDLVEKYNPTATIKESELLNLISVISSQPTICFRRIVAKAIPIVSNLVYEKASPNLPQGIFERLENVLKS